MRRDTMKRFFFLLLLHFLALSSSQANTNFNHYVWHWHLKLEMDQKSAQALQKIPIKGVFLRVGHFRFVDQAPLVRGLKKRKGFFDRLSHFRNFEEVHLAYSFSNARVDRFVRDYLNEKPEEAINFISRQIAQDLAFYGTQLSNVKGVQIDLEGAGVDFTIFENLMRRLKRDFPELILSITPMSSWYKKKEFEKVLNYTDLLVPMLYDYHRGKKSDGPLKVTDVEWLEKAIPRWDKLGKKWLIGTPTYSYCVFYNEEKKMKVPWALVAPDTASENRAFHPVKLDFNKGSRTKTMTRDRVLEYELKADMTFSNMTFRKGSKLKYNFLSVTALEEILTRIKSIPVKNAVGIAYFRFGVLGEKLVLDAFRLKKAIQSNFQFPVNLEVKALRVNKDSKLYLSLTNQSLPSYFGADGLTLKMQNCRILGGLGDFDRREKQVLIENYFAQNELLITPQLECSKDGLFSLEFTGYGGVRKSFQYKISEL